MADRQLAFVIDLNKCMGCQTCVVACKVDWTNDKGMDEHWWMTVSTMPGQGYPKDWAEMGGGHDAEGNVVVGRVPTLEDYGGNWEFNFDEVFLGGRSTTERPHFAPVSAPTWGPNWDEEIGAGEWPNAYFFYMPRLCNHCTWPSCVSACPYDALVKDPGNGVVTVADPRACETCTDTPCMGACPYKEIFRDNVTHHATKCHACAPRIETGVAPACVRMCPGRCIWVDYLDNESGPVHQLVERWKVALPLRPDFGNRPNVYYVPPIGPARFDGEGRADVDEPRIPTEYLRSLFGPGVDDALATLHAEMAKRRRTPKESSELVDLLIAKRWAALLGPFQEDPTHVEVAP